MERKRVHIKGQKKGAVWFQYKSLKDLLTDFGPQPSGKRAVKESKNDKRTERGG